MEIDITLLKTFAKQAFKALITILCLTGFGLFTNWVFLLFLSPELKSLFDTSGVRGGHGGGAAAILTVILIFAMNWKASLLFVTFFFIFPLLHFFFGKRYAIISAISSLLGQKKEQFVEYVLHKFFIHMNSKKDWLDKLNSSGILASINEYLPKYLKKLEGMPFLIRAMINIFLSKFDFLGIVSGIINEEGKIDISQEELIRKISNKVNAVLDEKVFSPSFQANWILYSINVFTFIAIKVLI